MGSKYYAVVSGITPGIYNDWITTERMVKGYPGAIFKSFRSKLDAETFMKKSTLTKTKDKVIPTVLPLADKTIIYSAGSSLNSEYGFGICMLTNTGDKITSCGKVPPTVLANGYANNIAELYAIYVSLSLVKGDIVLYSDSQYAISTLTIYVNEWIKNGWKGVSNRSLIEGSFNLMNNRSVTLLLTDKHTNVEFNEDAGELANKGRVQNEHLVVFKNGNRIM